MKKWNHCVIAGIIGLASCGGGGNKPTPVKVLNPGMRPDLDINAILLDNGTAVGCEDFQGFFGPPPNPNAKSQQHWEPPIGGEDGSFRLYMRSMPLSGTSTGVRKGCTSADHGSGDWLLYWKVADPTGAVVMQNSNGVNVGLDVPVKIEFNGSAATVTIKRTSDNSGTVWRSETTATFLSSSSDIPAILPNAVNEANELQDSNAASIRMKKIKVGADEIDLIDPNHQSTCASFIICHGGINCTVPPPTKCLQGSGGGNGGTGTAKPGDDKPHVH